MLVIRPPTNATLAGSRLLAISRSLKLFDSTKPLASKPMARAVAEVGTLVPTEVPKLLLTLVAVNRDWFRILVANRPEPITRSPVRSLVPTSKLKLVSEMGRLSNLVKLKPCASLKSTVMAPGLVAVETPCTLAVSTPVVLLSTAPPVEARV